MSVYGHIFRNFFFFMRSQPCHSGYSNIGQCFFLPFLVHPTTLVTTIINFQIVASHPQLLAVATKTIHPFRFSFDHSCKLLWKRQCAILCPSGLFGTFIFSFYTQHSCIVGHQCVRNVHVHGSSSRFPISYMYGMQNLWKLVWPATQISILRLGLEL
jgi:hypothetical protein